MCFGNTNRLSVLFGGKHWNRKPITHATVLLSFCSKSLYQDQKQFGDSLKSSISTNVLSNASTRPNAQQSGFILSDQILKMTAFTYSHMQPETFHLSTMMRLHKAFKQSY
eukprot:TRINITY_DN70234_c0_g1_i1.p1 TRINITY_DN70234_c0_g1~~TRINITY_DN70234_c0_g1_i1.p1  ORF type:complete len:110 (+),score=11.20 TRINITY_DN70234_c0_g1_i1:215-544(+)